MKCEKSAFEFPAILYMASHSSFTSYFKGHILSSKSGIGDKGGPSAPIAPIKKDVAELANAEKIPQQAEQEVVRERRNGYETISTAAYYRTERRGLSGFDQQAQDWLQANPEIGAGHGVDSAPGVPYEEEEPDR